MRFHSEVPDHMPIITNITKKPPTIQQQFNKLTKALSEKYDAVVGTRISEQHMRYHIPEDDFYYFTMSLADTKDGGQKMIDGLIRQQAPYEYCYSPDKCLCFRVHRRYEDHPNVLKMLPNSQHTCPVAIPVYQFGKWSKWRMYQRCLMKYLYPEENWVRCCPQPRIRKKSCVE